MGGKEKEGVAGKKGYINSSSGNFLVQGSTCEFLLVNEHKMAQPLFFRTTRLLMNDKPRDKI